MWWPLENMLMVFMVVVWWPFVVVASWLSSCSWWLACSWCLVALFMLVVVVGGSQHAFGGWWPSSCSWWPADVMLEYGRGVVFY
ncbi:unnamed protein product [Meloidogyne enterolobii]|uniref:Uncharacterized protein n=1 Tax=Meloidogyne enterolobii TaxID=390850 RepID=A0ACB0YQC3_MELEN